MALTWTATDSDTFRDDTIATLREPKYDDNASSQIAAVMEIRGERVRLTATELGDLITVAARLKMQKEHN